MAKIKVTNPKQIINGGAKKYYFKVKGVGGIKGDKGDKGDTGSQGPQGPQGNAATIEVGSTTTLPTGYDATVTNTGTINNAILNFGIPRGIKGDTGAKGDKGDKGDKGEQGNTGPQGPAGQNATVDVGTTTTGAPGTQASVYNSGTDRNAVLNFTIPRGAAGATGATGPQGPAGQDGQNFTPTIVETLPATGDQSKLYLTPKNYTTGTATGNPITISLSEDAGQITSFQLDGDTFQQSYTGKNLWPINSSIPAFNCTITPGDNSLTLLATGANSNIYPEFYLDTDTQYTFSGEFKITNYVGASSIGAIIQGYDGNAWVVIKDDRSEVSDTNTHTFSVSFNSASYSKARVGFGTNVWNTSVANTVVLSNPQLEKGSTATAYEPFVGGQPSPNPDYPQAIQTVTGEQTVEVVGKNLFDIDSIITGYELISATGEVRANADWWVTPLIPVKAGEAYTSSNMRVLNKVFYNENGDFVSTITAKTATAPADARYMRMNAKLTDIPNYVGKAQLELGSTATTYAPYSKQTLPISLGSIELCKLGDYQDYIYKDGNDWKVHKAIAKATLDGSEDWSKNTNANPFYVANIYNKIGACKQATSPASALFSHFTTVGIYGSDTNLGACVLADAPLSITNIRARLSDMSGSSSSFKTILSEKRPVLYARKDVPADTTITDTALIAQLEAIRTASLQNGANTITNTATGTNLAGDMELGYYEYDPTNRYDKWLWLDLNNNYEKLGS